jgi:hypothetical protein
MRGDLVLGEAAGEVPEGALLLGEVEVHADPIRQGWPWAAIIASAETV